MQRIHSTRPGGHPATFLLRSKQHLEILLESTQGGGGGSCFKNKQDSEHTQHRARHMGQDRLAHVGSYYAFQMLGRSEFMPI